MIRIIRFSAYLTFFIYSNAYSAEWSDSATFEARATIVKPEEVRETPYTLEEWTKFCCTYLDSKNVYKGEQGYCLELIENEDLSCESLLQRE